MKKSRFTEHQIIHALKRIESGEETKSVCRDIGVSQQTLYVWKRKYSGLGTPELRKLKEQESEITRLKRLVADLMLDKQILQDVLSKKH